jgi:Fe-S-cluster containining protein
MIETGCMKCGACCKWIGFSYKELLPEAKEFYHARGCEILYAYNDNGTDTYYRIYAPHKCRHLTDDNTCAIYANRPEVCKHARGYEDPITANDCKWKSIIT